MRRWLQAMKWICWSLAALDCTFAERVLSTLEVAHMGMIKGLGNHSTRVVPDIDVFHETC